MKPTIQQEAIIEAVARGTGNVAGVARAGTGKTETFVMASREVNELLVVVAMAFNKNIAMVMEKKFPPHWLSKTTHSFSYGAWMQRCPHKCEVVSKKMREILWDLPEANKFPDAIKAISVCKAWGVVPLGALAEPQSMMPDEPGTYREIFSKYSIDVGDHPDPVGLVRQALLTSISQGWKGKIDFDDMLYLAAIYRARPRIEPDLILIDEAQDIAPIQRELLRLMSRPHTRLVAIGDDRQAIYGFRGADRMSLPKIIGEFNCEVLPLTVSFRCSKEVVREAQHIVPDIEYWDESPEGSVSVAGPTSYESFPRNAAILCRNNAPLMSACLGFIKRGIGASILGRDIAVGLRSLVDRQKAQGLGELSQKLWQDVDHRAGLLENRDQGAQADLLRDKAECIERLIAFIGRDGTVQSLRRQIDGMFSDKQGVVTLSTIHKAKGLEWPTVYILDPALIPSKWARTPEEQLQERNLLYVATTRAQTDLIYIDSEDLK